MFSKANPKQSALVISLIIFGLLLTTFFGMCAFHAFKRIDGYRPPPPGKVETDVELIRDWMTVSFIAKMYRVPEKDIFDALNIPPQGKHEKSLKDLNKDYYPDKDGHVMDTVKATILAHQPPPTPDSAPSTVTPPTAPTAP